ncbi:MAG: hypothetical protein GOMPHAMPRED_005082 [Gomphillus americanus]|uniref:Cyclin-D1-binding protein 1-like N-terminal domain-containing protein n=1 Tax=Gomphillus americanus TaxID=1940652 RepID=A0A8H3EIT0_9LECA|nr:MAG: hypothetical protein GOMPHAMPRED_005082 [Gomphillus americanus]
MTDMSNPASVRLVQDLAAARSLVSHLQETLSSASAEIVQPSGKPINPLALSSTAASLIKAHTTKLTLLSLNKPFTPSSIGQILNSISTSPLPALLTAVQICDPTKFSKFGKHELHIMTARLFTAYGNLLAEIPSSEEEQARKLSATELRPTGSNEQNPALIGTGLVWEICDEITAFAEQGLGARAAKQMISYRDLYVDATKEIDSWRQDANKSGSIENHMDNLQLGESDSDVESIESFSMGPTKEMIPVTEWTLEILEVIAFLFAPLIKRRIKRFPTINSKTVSEPMKEDIARLDKLLDAGKYWSEQIDAIAESLFENDREMSISLIDQLAVFVNAEVQDIKLGWDGSEDELSTWLVQWSERFAHSKATGRPST